MKQIILTVEQMQVLAGKWEPIVISDPSGNIVAVIDPPMSPEQAAELRRNGAAKTAGHSGAEVQAMLQALDMEWERIGEFDEEYMRDFIKRFRARESA